MSCGKAESDNGPALTCHIRDIFHSKGLVFTMRSARSSLADLSANSRRKCGSVALSAECSWSGRLKLKMRNSAENSEKARTRFIALKAIPHGRATYDIMSAHPQGKNFFSYYENIHRQVQSPVSVSLGLPADSEGLSRTESCPTAGIEADTRCLTLNKYLPSYFHDSS